MRIAVLLGLFLILVGYLIATKEADAVEYYQWTTEDGVVSFTDDTKQIPARYKDRALEGDTKDLDGRLTPTGPNADYAKGLRKRLDAVKASNSPVSIVNPEGCNLPVVVTSKRIQVGDHNRTVYIVTDECGRTVTVTPFTPDVQINR